MGCYLNWYVNFTVKPGTTERVIFDMIENDLDPGEYESRDFLTDLANSSGVSDMEFRIAHGKLHCGYNGEAGHGTADDLTRIMQAVADKFADWSKGPVEFTVWSDDDDREGDTSFYGPRDVTLTQVLECMRRRMQQLHANMQVLEEMLTKPGKRVPMELPELEGEYDISGAWLESCKVKRD